MKLGGLDWACTNSDCLSIFSLELGGPCGVVGLSSLQGGGDWTVGTCGRSYCYLLRTVFLQVPTVPNLVGVVEMSELRTWYEKVTKDDVASAYVLRPLELPSSQFTRGWNRRLKADERD
jgi:hypothetical protein